MRQKLIIFFLFFVAISASAQRLGPKADFQLTQGFQTVDVPEVNFGATPGAGFGIGVHFDWDITNRWGFEASVMYNLRSTNYRLHYLSDTATIMRRQVYFLNIPLHAYVNFPFRKWTLALFVGPSFNVGLHGNDIAWQDTELQKPVMLEKDEMFGDDGRLMRFEIGAEIGLNAKIGNYMVSLGYHHGFNNLLKNDYNWTLDLPENCKKHVGMGEVKLSFAYMFNLGK